MEHRTTSFSVPKFWEWQLCLEPVLSTEAAPAVSIPRMLFRVGKNHTKTTWRKLTQWCWTLWSETARNTLKCTTTDVQVVWNFIPCPWLESSVRGTCHGVWLIYPVTFHNLVLLIHDDNTTFSKEDTSQAIMLKVKYKKTCPGGETCRGAPAVQQADPRTFHPLWLWQPRVICTWP